MWDPASPYKGKIGPYDAPIYLADAAVYLMTPGPSWGSRTRTRWTRPSSTPRSSWSRQQKPLVAEYWADVVKQAQRLRERRATQSQALADHREPRERRVRHVGGRRSRPRGRDRLVRHLDDQEGHPEHQLRVPVAEPRGVRPKVQRPDRRVLRRGAGEPEVVRADHERGSLRGVPRRGDRLLEQVWYWTTPVENCVDGRTDVKCVPYDEWARTGRSCEQLTQRAERGRVDRPPAPGRSRTRDHRAPRHRRPAGAGSLRCTGHRGCGWPGSSPRAAVARAALLRPARAAARHRLLRHRQLHRRASRTTFTTENVVDVLTTPAYLLTVAADGRGRGRR